jgi:hypothetical protein
MATRPAALQVKAEMRAIARADQVIQAINASA